jgi:hypothetical protein
MVKKKPSPTKSEMNDATRTTLISIVQHMRKIEESRIADERSTWALSRALFENDLGLKHRWETQKEIALAQRKQDGLLQKLDALLRSLGDPKQIGDPMGRLQ